MVNTVLSLGFTEICTYSFMSPKAYDKICLPADSPLRNSVIITNPLGEDTSIMRTTSLASMMEIIAKNYNNRNLAASLFENATVYSPNGTEELPTETRMLTLGMYGGCDYFTLKGKVEKVLETAGVTDYDVEPVKDDPSYHPGRTAEILVDGKRLAILGEIHPDVLENYSVGTKVYVAQINSDMLYEIKNTLRLYKHLPKYPALTRDLAFVCDRDMPVLRLEKLMKNAAGKNLEHIELFDVYQGGNIAADKKSVAFSLRLRANDRTLTDEEADSAVKKIIKALGEVGAVLRS